MWCICCKPWINILFTGNESGFPFFKKFDSSWKDMFMFRLCYTPSCFPNMTLTQTWLDLVTKTRSPCDLAWPSYRELVTMSLRLAKWQRIFQHVTWLGLFETRSTFQILLRKWDRVIGRTTPRFLMMSSWSSSMTASSVFPNPFFWPVSVCPVASTTSLSASSWCCCCSSWGRLWMNGHLYSLTI